MARFLEILPAAIGPLIVAALAWAASRSKPESDPQSGVALFRFHIAMRVSAWVELVLLAILPSLYIPLVFVVDPPKNKSDVVAVFVPFTIVATLGIVVWWITIRFVLLVTPEGLDCRLPWRGWLHFRWDEIEEISWSTMNQWFILKAKDRRKIRFSTFVSGASEFLALCEKNLPASVLSKAVPGYMEVGRPFPGPNRKT